MVSVQVQKKRSWKELVEEGKRVLETRDMAQWKLGDLANEVETHYGGQDLQKYADEIGVNYSSLRVYQAVSRKFEFATRVAFLLPWSYFRVVAGLDLDTALWLLEEAKKEGWTYRRLEEAVKGLRPEEEKLVECDLCERKFSSEETMNIRLCAECAGEFTTYLNLKRVKIESA
jgi:hypothetical protein